MTAASSSRRTGTTGSGWYRLRRARRLRGAGTGCWPRRSSPSPCRRPVEAAAAAVVVVAVVVAVVVVTSTHARLAIRRVWCTTGALITTALGAPVMGRTKPSPASLTASLAATHTGSMPTTTDLAVSSQPPNKPPTAIRRGLGGGVARGDGRIAACDRLDSWSRNRHQQRLVDDDRLGGRAHTHHRTKEFSSTRSQPISKTPTCNYYP